MSCVRKLFKRKFFRTQSSETILVAQQSDNSPSDPLSSSTTSADHDDASSVCSDGNVTSVTKASAPDQPNVSTATASSSVIVASSRPAASTSALLIPPERRRPHSSVGPQLPTLKPPPSSPLSISLGKRPSFVSETPAPAKTIPDLTSNLETKRSVRSASFKQGLPAAATRGGKPSRDVLRLQQNELTVTDMEGTKENKVRLEGQPSSPTPTSSSPLESASHSKGVLTSVYLSPKLTPAATESKVLTAIISSQQPGYSFNASARLERGSPLVSSSLNQGASSSTSELQAEDGGSFLPLSSAPEVSFLTDGSRISEPSLLSDLPQTTPPGAWGEELDVEAPPTPEALDRGYTLPDTETSHMNPETYSAPYPPISPVLACLVHPVYDASISDDVILPEDLFFECDDSGETLEAPGMERPRNPTPHGARRLGSYPECSGTLSNQSVETSEAKMPPAKFRADDASTKIKGGSKAVFKEGAKGAQMAEVTTERKEDEKHLEGIRQQDEGNEGEKAEEEDEEEEEEEEEEAERRKNEEEENVPLHLMDVFELGKMCSRSRAKLNSTDQRLSRRQKKIFILQQQVMQQAEELKELTRLTATAEAQALALKEEKKELDAELQKTCDQLTDVDEVNTKKHEPLMYKKFSAIKTAAEAKTLLLSIRSRQKALYYLEAMTYRKCVALQHNLKVSGSATGSDKDRKLSKRMCNMGPGSPKKSRKLKDQLSLSSAAMPSTAVLPALPLMLSAVSVASVNGTGLGPLFFPVQETQQQQQQTLQQALGQQAASRSSSLSNAMLLFDEFRETEV